jgi:5'-methylthioadenosine phosphorylase
MLGLIGGSGLLESSALAALVPEQVETPYGKVIIRVDQNRTLAFCQRHAANPDHEYTPPHSINKHAIIWALHSLKCEPIVAFCSVGSLQKSIPVGTLMVPDDYYDPTSGAVTFFDYSKQGHVGPTFNEPLRARLLSILQSLSLPVLSTGTYCLTAGPRFETKAEIRALARCGDIVGMTGAHEAMLAQELGIGYAIVCIVDNMANGLADEQVFIYFIFFVV